MLKGLRDRARRNFQPSPYIYAALPKTGELSYTRLLTLLPTNSAASPLMGHLQAYALGEVSGKYEAVSYEWTPPHSPGSAQILVDGKSLTITRNLSDCLSRLRANGKRLLWIDAICINQADLVERTAQVAMMGRIYSSAARTLGWLGDSDVGTGTVDQALESKFHMEAEKKAIFDFFRLEADHLRASSDHDGEMLDTATEWQAVATMERSQGLGGVKWTNIQSFFYHSYFGRRWIIQEIALAREVQLIWGPHHLDWNDFLVVAKRVKSGRLSSETMGPLAHNCLHQAAHQPDRSNVMELMRTFDWARCGDPIDEIAALQGLWRVHGESSTPFSVDYSLSVEVNYVRFAEMLVRTSDCGQLLLCAISSSRSSTLPSWVPDWREWTFLPLDHYHHRIELAYSPVLGSNSSLILRGWIVDEIGEIRKEDQCKFEMVADHLNEWYTNPMENDEPWGRPQRGDKICTFSYGTILDTHQFVIRETSTKSSEYHLVNICQLSGSATKQDMEGRQRQYDSEPVKIVLV